MMSKQLYYNLIPVLEKMEKRRRWDVWDWLTIILIVGLAGFVGAVIGVCIEWLVNGWPGGA